jgi:ABC-type multidrug transport system permease subunit
MVRLRSRHPEEHVLTDAMFLMLRDLMHLLRRRETLLWTFVMPVIFFYFIGNVAGGYGRIDEADPIAVVNPAGSGFLADELVKRLELHHFRVVRQVEFFRQLRIPAGFTDSVLAGRPMQIEFIRHGSGINTDYDQLRINRAIYSLLGDLGAMSSRGVTPSIEAFGDLAKQVRPVSLEVTSAGKRKIAPIGFEQAVPGVLVMFVLLVMFTVCGVTILVERRQSILLRLASSPMSRGMIVLAKWGARALLGFTQIMVAMITGTILFKVHWGEHLGAIMLVLAAYSSLAALLGLLLGNFARSEGQVIGMGVVASNVMAALGGCWWPIEITPQWTQRIASVFPTGWAMDALHRLMSFGDSPAAVIPHVAAFVAVALIAASVLACKFRFQ